MKSHSARRLRIAGLAVLAAAAIPLLVVELVYRFEVARLPGIPVPPEPPPPPEVQLLPTWRELGGDDPVRMRAIYPWNLHGLLPIDDPDDPSVKASRYVALGLLASTWGESLPSVPSNQQQRREIALSVWVSRHYSARQALGTLRTWQGWSAWPESDVVPKAPRVRFGNEYPPPPVPGRLQFPGGSVAVPKGCHAPAHVVMGIDAWMDSIECTEGPSILVFGGVLGKSSCDSSGHDPGRVVALRTLSGDTLCVGWWERQHASTGELVQELFVEVGGTSFISEIRGPEDALLLLGIGSTFEPSEPVRK